VSRVIRVELLSDLIRDVLISGKIKNEAPLSLILVAPPEHGKSELLSQFSKNPSVSWCNDLSSNPLITDILPDVEKKIITHIVIPDFLKILTHSKRTTQSLLTLLNSLTAEGIKDINFYGVERHFDYPIKAGVVMAMTREALERRKVYWKDIGFLARCIPVSYRYSDLTIRQVHDWIKLGDYSRGNYVHLPRRIRDVDIKPKFSKKVDTLQASWREKVQSFTGFRLHKQFRTLLKAIAYRDEEVNSDHLLKLTEYLKYINFDYNVI